MNEFVFLHKKANLVGCIFKIKIMQNKNKESVQNKLKAYSLLAGTAVLAVGNDANANIIYTDINPDTTLNTHGAIYDLDLNNDATNDFRFTLSKVFIDGNPGISFSTQNIARIQPLNPSNEILGNNVNKPFALNNGAVISNGGTTWLNAASQTLLSYFRSVTFTTNIASLNRVGNWQGHLVDKYLGLKLVVGADTYYGWARLDVDSSANFIRVKDYAFKNIPDQSINAGEFNIPAGTISGLTVADIAENSNGSDLQVSFNKAADEAKIDSYRVIVVPSAEATAFNLDSAESVLTGNYIPVAKTGSNIIQVLPANAKDKNGNAITIGVAYKVFVLSMADGVNANQNALSSVSAEITLNTTVAAAGNVQATDVADNNDGSDLQVSFDKAASESNMSEYRIIVVKDIDAGSFDLAAANGVADGNYTSITPTGSNIQQTLDNTAKDKDGNAISENITYRIFVLSVADGTNANVNALSGASASIVLANVGLKKIKDYNSIDLYNVGQNIIISSQINLDQASLMLHNLLGQVVYSEKLSGQKTNIEVQNLKGVYAVSIIKDGQQIMLKRLLF